MRAKDESDFAEFFAGRAASVQRAAYALCGDWHQAEDLTQTAFGQVYRAWPRIRSHDALNAYVHQTLVRTYLNERRRGRREIATARVPDRSLSTQAGSAVDDRLSLLAALDRVPPRQRACLVLRYLLDYSIEQTAEAVGCTASTVTSQTSRGLAALRGALGDVTASLTPMSRKDNHGRD